MRIRSHHKSPMLVVAAGIVEEQRFSVVEQQHPTEHVAVTDVTHTFRMAAGISHGQAKVVIAVTHVVRHTRLCARKHKDAGLPIVTNLVVDKGRPGLR